ncbi:PAS domain S-box protein [Sphingomonas sp. HDW15A]|uniref:sensor histidine kinase n=1 Tax=Sphingomonas sp. HDW15A TaxID=2714942 RepID=UPI00140819E2|nr:PAS domain-containing sensor histidine kinase [Sphingomonas sp. HDW15A]QIK95469.1 PAS domain S-box protein [Sphingomonas sp. HDW15A]
MDAVLCSPAMRSLIEHGSWSEAHLRSILATIPDAMVIIDDQGIIISFSAAAEKMFGYAEADVVGENVAMLMPSPDRERHDGYLENYRNTGERKIIGIGRVTTARHRDGFTFPIELSIGEALIGQNRIFTGFIHDISERQQAELRLRDLQSELAHVGRVSEIASFASSLAHELNQPLTAIANYCEAARDLVPDTDGDESLLMLREALEEAAREALRAGQIVQHLREFVRHGDSDRAPESVSRLVTESSALALIGSREQGIEVHVEIDSRVDDVFVDRIQIQQVLTNLIRNAVDAMAESEVRSLSIRAQGQPERFVTISVKDTGCGISEDVMPRLFEPFVTSKSSGMGIGLSICRTIIESHGGRIWCEPNKGGGTICSFTLPVAEDVS